MLKRAFDIIISTFFLFPFLPSNRSPDQTRFPGPVLHRAQRIGKDGKPFTLYKFRTMIADAPQRGPGITHGNDPRITCVGRILRKLKIDEMPQLINVLKGEMSIVGPLLCRGAEGRGSKGAGERRSRGAGGEFTSAPLHLCSHGQPRLHQIPPRKGLEINEHITVQLPLG